jgi:hypothetical protein
MEATSTRQSNPRFRAAHAIASTSNARELRPLGRRRDRLLRRARDSRRGARLLAAARRRQFGAKLLLWRPSRRSLREPSLIRRVGKKWTDCRLFCKPSDGLEPSTPSLPWRLGAPGDGKRRQMWLHCAVTCHRTWRCASVEVDSGLTIPSPGLATDCPESRPAPTPPPREVSEDVANVELRAALVPGTQRLAPGQTWLCLLAVRHDESSSPTRGTSSRWQMHRLDLEATADDEPGGQRVGVPHLSCSALVAAPDETRNGGHEVEDVLSERWVVCQVLWAFDCLADIWDNAVAPAAYLVAEDPETSRPAASDRTFGNNAALPAVLVADWCLLDHEAAIRHAHHKPRVIEVARRSPCESRSDRLEDPPVQPHRVATRP